MEERKRNFSYWVILVLHREIFVFVMVKVEFHFRANGALYDEVESIEMSQFSFEAVEEVINSHWDHVLVQKWRIMDTNLMEGEDTTIRIDIIGEYISGEPEYFERPFTEVFKAHLLSVDANCDVDKELNTVNNEVNEVYVLSNGEKRYCVLDTNDIINGDDSIMVSKRGMNRLAEEFGEFDPHVEYPSAERIQDPIKVAKLIKQLHSLKDSNSNGDDNGDRELKNRMIELEWDLKVALFKDYHNEMIDALIEPQKVFIDGGSNMTAISVAPVSIRQVFVNRYHRFHAMLFERELLKLIAKGFWKTLTNAMVITMFVSLFDLSPWLVLLAVFNRETIDAQKKFVEELGIRRLISLVSSLEDTFEAFMDIYTFIIKLMVTIAIGRQDPPTEDFEREMTFTEMAFFYPIRVIQDLMLLIGTLYPPFATEYNRQMGELP